MRKKYFTLEERLAAHAAVERTRRAAGKVLKTKGVCPQCGGGMDRHRRLHNICRICYVQSFAINVQEKYASLKDRRRALRLPRTSMRMIDRQQYERAWRLEVMEILGGACCARCDFSDLRALQIDHINGDGKLERDNGAVLWKNRLLVKAQPETIRAIYQVLCANCNWIKRAERGEQRFALRVA